MDKMEGVISVLPTPFLMDGGMDEESLRTIIDLFLKAGVKGFTALGVTSETARLTEKEKARVVAVVLDHVSGRVPVIVGTTAEGTQICVEQTRAAVEAGASAVMISPPRMPKLNSEAVVRHYQAVSDAVQTEIVLQDYPPVSGYSLETSLVVRITRDVPAVTAIKLEDAPTPLKISRIREIASEKVAIYGGLGGMYLLEELIAGATGAMTGFAIPEILVRIVHHFYNGELEQAKNIFYRSVALMRFEFQEGIGMAIRKEILRRRGALQNSIVRSPAPQLDPSTRLELDELLEWYERNEGLKI
jgi:4-hydroxy-tetrahydrodipicolinate synthase